MLCNYLVAFTHLEYYRLVTLSRKGKCYEMAEI